MQTETLNLLDYLPHRPPMLLLSRIIDLSAAKASAEVEINAHASFYVPNKGVPAWIGIEYMGQTAALIAGHQQQCQQLSAHTGFLLGTRRYQTSQAWFPVGARLHVQCEQAATVGETLATFDCSISLNQVGIATARLSVFRRPATEINH